MSDMNKLFFIYKVTNKINNRFYIGMHTKNLEDGYLGSGKRIKAEVKKYGKENFEREILEYLPCRQSLAIREKEIVNEELLTSPLCLNLKNGGEGGGKFINEEHRLKCSTASINAIRDHKALQAKRLATMRSRNNFNSFDKFPDSALLNAHSEKARAKRLATNLARNFMKGENNSQFGTCWVTNGIKPLKIKKDLLNEYLENGYSRGRKV